MYKFNALLLISFNTSEASTCESYTNRESIYEVGTDYGRQEPIRAIVGYLTMYYPTCNANETGPEYIFTVVDFKVL